MELVLVQTTACFLLLFDLKRKYLIYNRLPVLYLSLNRMISMGLRLTMMTLFLSALAASAGEKILVGNEKSTVDPDKSPKVGADFLKNWKQDIETDPVVGNALLMPNLPPTPVDPKNTKLQKLKRLEEMNWMFVDKGELQQEEEDKNRFGVQDDPLENFDKEDTAGNLIFRGLKPGQSDAKGRTPGQITRNSSKNQPIRVNHDEDDLGLGLRSSKTSNKPEIQTGSQINKELDFRKLFENSARSAASPRSDSSGSTLFGSGSASVLSRGQQLSREQYRTFLNGSAAATPAETTWNADTRALPGMSPSPLMPNRSSSFDNYNPSQNYNQYRSGMDTPGKSDWNMGRVSGFGSLTPPNLTPSTPKAPEAFSGFQPTRARGMNSLGGR